MPAFIITAKSDRCGRKIKKGQTFQIVTNYETVSYTHLTLPTSARV